jgi:hypothetical protein
MKPPPKKSPQSEKLRDASARLSAKSTQLASKSERLIARAHKATREQQAGNPKTEPYFDHSA